MADFPVKWFCGDMGGSPGNPDELGALIEMMKACLVTGFNITPIGSMTYDAASGEATVTLATGHGFMKWQIVEVSGADQAQFNGQHRVTAIGSDWIKFVLEEASPTATATGDLMEVKAAPADNWEIVAEDAESYQIALKRSDPRATYLTLVIKNGDRYQYETNADNRNRFAWVGWVTDFVDFDVHGPEDAKYWAYSDYYLPSSKSARDWVIVADSLMIFYMPRYGHRGQRGFYMGGDIETVRPGDAYHCINNGFNYSYGFDSNYNMYPDSLDFESTYLCSLSRSYTQLPGDAPAALIGMGYRMGDVIGYPNAADNGLYVSTGKLLVREGPAGNDADDDRPQQLVRGYLPGVLQPLQSTETYDQAIIDNLPNLDGVPVLFCMVANYYSDDDGHLVAFRLDDWR